MSTQADASMAYPPRSPENAPGTTEIVSAERLWAYAETAHELGSITVDVVAQPGDTMFLGRPINGFRTANHRDKGDFLGTNLDEAPAGRGVRTEEVPEGRYGIVVTTPWRETSISGDRDSLRDLYEGSNQRHDEIRAARRGTQPKKSADN